MKQQIMQEQWNELNNEQQQLFCDIIGLKYIDFNHQRNIDGYLNEYLNIGQMIEFLGEDLDCIELWPSGDKYSVETHLETNDDDLYTTKEFTNNELVDALWEAVKYKLKK